MTFIVGCPKELKVNIIEGPYPVTIEGQNYTDIQYVDVSNKSSPATRFILPPFTSSSGLSYCGVKSGIKVSSNDTRLDTGTEGSFLNDATEIKDDHKAVVPQNISIHKEYLFYLMI